MQTFSVRRRRCGKHPARCCRAEVGLGREGRSKGHWWALGVPAGSAGDATERDAAGRGEKKLPLGSLEWEHQRQTEKRWRSLRGCSGGVPSRSNHVPRKEIQKDIQKEKAKHKQRRFGLEGRGCLWCLFKQKSRKLPGAIHLPSLRHFPPDSSGSEKGSRNVLYTEALPPPEQTSSFRAGFLTALPLKHPTCASFQCAQD